MNKDNMKEVEREFVRWALKGHEAAIAYCDIIFNASQMYDDFIDMDNPWNEEDIHSLMWSLLVDLVSNPFFMQFAPQLIPLHRQYLNDYRDSVILERDGSDHEKTISFILRDSVSTLVIQVAYMVGGKQWMDEVSLKARKVIYSERLETYKSHLE
jgi:hypothetical protein